MLNVQVALYNPETDSYFLHGRWMTAFDMAQASLATEPPPLPPLKLRMVKAARRPRPLLASYTD